MIKLILGVIILVYSNLFFSLPALAAENGLGLGAKIGLYFPDGMTVEGNVSRDFDTDPGLTLGLFTNIRLGNVGYFSPFLDLSSFKNGAGDGVTLVDIGLDIKILTGDGGIRPGGGLALGLGSLGTDPQIGFVTEQLNIFLVYKLFVEMDISHFIAEAGLRGYTGGNEEDVYINPGLYLRAGMMF